LRFALSSIDRISLSIIAALFLFLLLGRNQLLPYPPDGYYHLLVAQNIVRLGEIPLWADWEYAPLGRPHLYPPLYHLLVVAASAPSGFDILAGFRLVLAVLLPFTLLSFWYLVRWLFDDRRALLAMLILGMDLTFMIQGLMGLPSVLASGFSFLLLICFLKKRVVLFALLAALMLYTHLGIPAAVLAGLFIFSLFRREYLRNYLIGTACALVMAAPWYVHIWQHRAWFHHPIDLGIYGNFEGANRVLIKLAWLQFINLIPVLLFIVACRKVRWCDTRHQLLLWQGLAFSPMLFSYGGRFLAHSIPYWSVIIAALFTPLLTTRKRIAVALLLALSPGLVVMGFGSVLSPGVYPMPSGWLAPPVAATIGRSLSDDGKTLGFLGLEEARALGDHIRANTSSDQIVHCGGRRDFGIMVGFMAQRPIDLAAWEEVYPDSERRERVQRTAADDPTGIYILRTQPRVKDSQTTWTAVGRYHIGIRNRPPGLEQEH
jgi:4-amino-4-deoxy-L-arabinose transferase-like glycosyltransferase